MSDSPQQSEQTQGLRDKFSMYRVLVVVLVLLLIAFQVQLWMTDGSMAEVHRLREQKQKLQAAVEQARERNQALAAEIENLRHGEEAMVGRARSNFGMIKEGETFFLTIRPSETNQPARVKDSGNGAKQPDGTTPAPGK